eukprot:1160789-Pelagomonas_calceolata.AAC.3
MRYMQVCMHCLEWHSRHESRRSVTGYDELSVSVYYNLVERQVQECCCSEKSSRRASVIELDKRSMLMLACRVNQEVCSIEAASTPTH